MPAALHGGTRFQKNLRQLSFLDYLSVYALRDSCTQPGDCSPQLTTAPQAPVVCPVLSGHFPLFLLEFCRFSSDSSVEYFLIFLVFTPTTTQVNFYTLAGASISTSLNRRTISALLCGPGEGEALLAHAGRLRAEACSAHPPLAPPSHAPAAGPRF